MKEKKTFAEKHPKINFLIGLLLLIGIGSVGGVLVGIIRYGESANWKRLVCIAMILSSVVGLKLVS